MTPVHAQIDGDGDVTGGRAFHLSAPELGGARPGQFLMVAVPPDMGVLRRPYWLASAGPDGCAVAVQERGPASRWLAAHRAGDTLDVLGPLGRPVALPPPGTRCVLVGDPAAPPLTALAQALRDVGCALHHLPDANALTAALAPAPGPSAAAPGPDAAVVPGPAAAVPGPAAAPTPAPGSAVFAAGPRALLAAAAAGAAAAGAPIAVATAPFMACGTGLCGTCAVPVLTPEEGEKASLPTVSPQSPAAVESVATADGAQPPPAAASARAGGPEAARPAGLYVRACVEGPVLDGHRIDWARWLAEAEPAPAAPAGPPSAWAGRSGRVRPEDVDLAVDLGPVSLRGPLLAASGTAGGGAEFAALTAVAGIGAIVAKTVTLEPRAGLPGPRAVETAGGMLNAIGLANPGVDAWRDRDLPGLTAARVPLIASIAGRTAHEYGQVAARLRGAAGLLAIEANISCPNVEDRDRVFATRPETAAAAVAAAVAASDLPVFAKLTLDVTDIAEVAAAVVAAGAVGVTVANTLLGLSIDAETGRPRLGGGTGGLSGPAIKPVALRAVAQVARALPDLPIIGLGGVRSVTDVVEYVLAGASAVAVGTANFARPGLTLDLTWRLAEWLAVRGHRSLAELRGGVRW